MKGFHTVNAVAEMAGVSVRTLHHYDQIGLLSPAFVGANRYRFYGEEELLKLQQILVHRELGLTLSEIGTLLASPGYDRIETLRRQRERIAEAASRYQTLLGTIDRTIARLNGDTTMTDNDLYSGVVDPKKQAEYEAALIEQNGPQMADWIETSKEAARRAGPETMAERMAELEAIEGDLVNAMREGAVPQARALDPLIARHHAWVIAMWGQDAPLSAYVGLADTYFEHPDFRARYEALAPGFGDFLPAAIKAWVRRQEA